MRKISLLSVLDLLTTPLLFSIFLFKYGLYITCLIIVLNCAYLVVRLVQQIPSKLGFELFVTSISLLINLGLGGLMLLLFWSFSAGAP